MSTTQIANRREVLGGLAATGLLTLWHPPALFGAVEPAHTGSANEPRLLAIELETSAPLVEMKRFYHQLLGLPLLTDEPAVLALGAGATRLTFVPAADLQQPVVYHFAFNIPRNKVLAARAWHLERAPLIPAWGDLAEPNVPREVVHFRHWNAQSLFFFDPAFNIVEYIARHDLATDAAGPFTAKDLLYASEIGMMVERPLPAAEIIHRELGWNEYPRGTDWWAMGDQRGLLLCLQTGRLWGTHTATPQRFATQPVKVTVRGDRQHTFGLPGYPFTVRSEAGS